MLACMTLNSCREVFLGTAYVQVIARPELKKTELPDANVHRIGKLE